MTLPNLDATGHRWVAALAGFNMTIEYIKGSDNKVADCLSQVTECLDADSVRELIQHTKAGGAAVRAETNDPKMVQEDERIDNEIIVQAKAFVSRKVVFKNVSNKHWVTAQVSDPVIKHVRTWVCRPKENKISLSDYLAGKVADADRLAYSRRQKDLVMSHNLLYMQHSPPGTDEKGLAFVVLARK